MKEKKFESIISENEAQIVYDLIEEHNIAINNLHILIGEDKYIAGIVGNNLRKETVNYFKYNHFIESINDLALKTKLSIKRCIEEYLKVNIHEYNPISNDISKTEQSAYYFMENALFRVIVLWDSLAQLYNLYFDLGLDISAIHYKPVIKKLKNNNELDFIELNSYIEEDLDNNLDKGVHKYVNNLRNQMTHRYSIAITSFSENQNIRAMPDAIYRIAKDYNTVMKKICEITDLILIKVNGDMVNKKVLTLNKD